VIYGLFHDFNFQHFKPWSIVVFCVTSHSIRCFTTAMIQCCFEKLCWSC